MPQKKESLSYIPYDRSGVNNPMYGKKRPDLVERNKNPEFREYVRKLATGRKLSEETKRKVGLASKLRVTEKQKDRMRYYAFLKQLQNLPAGKRTDRKLFKKLRQQVLNDDQFTCTYHNARCNDLTVDHIKPLAKGGENERWNLIPACRSANASKNDKYGLAELLLVLYNNWRWEQGII